MGDGRKASLSFADVGDASAAGTRQRVTIAAHGCGTKKKFSTAVQ